MLVCYLLDTWAKLKLELADDKIGDIKSELSSAAVTLWENNCNLDQSNLECQNPRSCASDEFPAVDIC